MASFIFNDENKRGLLYLLAVGLALFIAIVAYLFWPAAQAPAVDSFYEPYPMYLNAYSTDSSTARMLEAAIAHYRSGDYEAALPEFQGLASREIFNGPYHFYAGSCFLQMGRPMEAGIHFEEAARREDDQFIQPAQWYLALSTLRQGKKDAARLMLEKIANGQGDFSEKARQLLQLIK